MSMTTNETVTLTIDKSEGYAGKRSERSYIARITGTCETYIFAREFVDTVPTDKAEMFTARRKGRGTWAEAAAVEAGLYEIQSCGERTYRIVWACPTKQRTVSTRVTADRAQAIALLMDDGQTYEAARLATKPPAKEVQS